MHFSAACVTFSLTKGSDKANMAQWVPNEARWLIAGSAGKGRKKTLITKWLRLDLGGTHNKYRIPDNLKNTQPKSG